MMRRIQWLHWLAFWLCILSSELVGLQPGIVGPLFPGHDPMESETPACLLCQGVAPILSGPRIPSVAFSLKRKRLCSIVRMKKFGQSDVLNNIVVL